MAAHAHLSLARGGADDTPSLEELTREMAARRGRGEIKRVTRIEMPKTGGGFAARLFAQPRAPAEVSPHRERSDAPRALASTRVAARGRAASDAAVGGVRGVAVLLSLAGCEKNLGKLLARLRAFSGTAFAPGLGELGDSLSRLERAGLVRKTSGEPLFVPYEITPRGAQELRARTPPAPRNDPATKTPEPIGS